MHETRYARCFSVVIGLMVGAEPADAGLVFPDAPFAARGQPCSMAIGHLDGDPDSDLADSADSQLAFEHAVPLRFVNTSNGELKYQLSECPQIVGNISSRERHHQQDSGGLRAITGAGRTWPRKSGPCYSRNTLASQHLLSCDSHKASTRS